MATSGDMPHMAIDMFEPLIPQINPAYAAEGRTGIGAEMLFQLNQDPYPQSPNPPDQDADGNLIVDDEYKIYISGGAVDGLFYFPQEYVFYAATVGETVLLKRQYRGESRFAGLPNIPTGYERERVFCDGAGNLWGRYWLEEPPGSGQDVMHEGLVWSRFDDGSEWDFPENFLIDNLPSPHYGYVRENGIVAYTISEPRAAQTGVMYLIEETFSDPDPIPGPEEKARTIWFMHVSEDQTAQASFAWGRERLGGGDFNYDEIWGLDQSRLNFGTDNFHPLSDTEAVLTGRRRSSDPQKFPLELFKIKIGTAGTAESTVLHSVAERESDSDNNINRAISFIEVNTVQDFDIRAGVAPASGLITGNLIVASPDGEFVISDKADQLGQTGEIIRTDQTYRIYTEGLEEDTPDWLSPVDPKLNKTRLVALTEHFVVFGAGRKAGGGDFDFDTDTFIPPESGFYDRENGNLLYPDYLEWNNPDWDIEQDGPFYTFTWSKYPLGKTTFMGGTRQEFGAGGGREFNVRVNIAEGALACNEHDDGDPLSTQIGVGQFIWLQLRTQEINSNFIIPPTHLALNFDQNPHGALLPGDCIRLR